jgi:hypothetical protein
VREDFVLNEVQNGKDLLALDAGESIEEDFNGVTGFQMVEETFDRHAGADEDGRAAHDLRIGMDDAPEVGSAHDLTPLSFRIACEEEAIEA